MVSLARRDALTGLGNRMAFEETQEDECARARRSTQPLSLLYIDLDSFKQVNDRNGHGAGDRALQQLATAVRAAIRARVDRAYRIGGDEFAVLLPGSTAEQAAAVLIRITEQCARLDPFWAAGLLGISGGVAEFASGETAHDFAQRADAAMYRIKQAKGTRLGG